MSDLTHIHQIYGHTDLYSILSIPRNSSSTQIREAYFCLRYDIYQQLSDENTDNGGTKLSAEERKAIEAKMDAITSTFRILTDPGRRIAYDSSLNDEEYIDKEPTKKVGASPNTTRVNRSVFRRKGASKVKPSQSGIDSSVGSRAKPQAETVNSFRKKNVERSIATEESYDSIFGGETASKTPSSVVGSGSQFSKGSNFDSIFGDESKASKGTNSTLQTNNISPTYSTEIEDDAISGHNTPHSGHSGVTSDFASFPSNPSAYQEHLPVGVNNLNIREQMLYKNQMYLHSQQTQDQKGTESKSRIASRYKAETRSDWLNDGEEMTVGEMTLDMRAEATTDDEDFETEGRSKDKMKRWNILRKSKVTSPTCVDDFDSFKDSPPTKEKKSYKLSTKSSSKSSKKISPSRFSFDDDTKASEYQDDDTRTHDDDTRTYDDDTNYDDETNYDDTTLGDTLEDTTVGDSTFASYDDETCASEGPKKFSPGHKKGNRPEPILRSSARSGKGEEKDDRRVIIHSHRGRKGKGDDEEFANTMCPFPSLTDIKEEVRGTCKDASSAFHQVLHAFVISPDDIDRMSDKIRDAKVELAENYHQQMKERKRASTGSARELSL
ncbi:hypothetical protein ACHAWO_009234 [Cyclotella atomus]|jgi:curved DNA-binding protein CbpA|uniref:J domain-containing protein n=1 Tax=Cyclotella atomus TaxID=382360 RepID=A0ABD3NDK3_9STRA